MHEDWPLAFGELRQGRHPEFPAFDGVQDGVFGKVWGYRL